MIVEYHFYENHQVVTGTRTIGRRRRNVDERLAPVPHQVGARGASHFELRILQDHVKGLRHEVMDSAALSTALACPQNILD